MNKLLKLSATSCIIFVSAILFSVAIIPGAAQAATSVSFGSFNAPWGWQGNTCAQNPVLVSAGLTAGQILSVSSITGSLCPRLYPRPWACVNDSSQGCSEDGHSNLTDGFNANAEIGFYNGSNSLIQEFPLSQFQSGITVPSGATSAYVYFKDGTANNDSYFDNNGGYKVTFTASVTSSCTANSYKQCSGNNVYWYDSCGNIGALYQACTSSQTCSNGTCVNQVIACSSNTDCGTNAYTGSPFCQGNSVYQNYQTFTCVNPGTSASYCFNNTTPQLQTTCTGSQTCSNGSCTNTCVAQQPYNFQVYAYQNSASLGLDTSVGGSGNQACANTNLAPATGIPVSVGEVISGTASGAWTHIYPGVAFYGPNGNGNPVIECTGFNTGYLVMKLVATDGTTTWMLAGSNFNQTMAKSGTLYFAFSDSDQTNNSGSVNVSLTATPLNSGYTTKQCVGNAVYNFDSCGNQGSLYQQCTSSQTCSNGACINNQPTTCSNTAGNTLVLSQNSNVVVTFLSSSASYNNQFGVYSPVNKALGYGHSTPSGTQFNIGQIPAGELMLYINNGAQTWFTGPAYRNVDGQVHANVCPSGTNQWTVSFEDQYGGGDRDFNDIILSVAATPAPLCTPNFTKQCVGNSVYNFDSCGVQGTLYQACTSSQTCSNGACVNNPASISIIAPTSSDDWTAGNQDYIKWNSTGVNYVNISVMNNSTQVVTQIASYVPAITVGTAPAQGNYLWTTPTSFTSGYYTMVITDSYNSNTTSSQVFQIYAPPSCTANSYKQCSGNNVYWYDSCGNIGALYQTCGSGQTCSNGACITQVCQAGTTNNASITINVTYFGNYTSSNPIHTANMSNSVYVGSSYIPYGTGSVTIPLTSNGVAIIDPISGDSVSWPGLHVTRENGYVKIAADGFNDSNSRESVQANFTFSNASLNNIQNDSSHPYELASTCGVIQGDAKDSNPGADRYTFSGNSGTLCSTTNTDADDMEIYYTPQTTTIACCSNTDCGTNAYTGSPFCQSGNVYQNYQTFTCNNAGTTSSYCSNNTVAQLQTTCTGNQTCQNAQCVNACTQNASKQCLGNNVYWYDSCGNQGSLYQACTTNQTCSNGACVNQTIACSSNTDCGTNAYTGNTFCQGNNVYQNYITYTCNNAGTPSSYCFSSTAAQVENTCAANQICTNGSCTNNCTPNASQQCVGNAVYSFDSCGVQGSLIQTCNSNQICSNGACVNQVIACSTNSQCGTNAVTGSAFCQGNNVYQNYITYTCNNPGTSASYCSNNTAAQLQTTCNGNQTCSNGSCGTIVCSSNSQCGTSAATGSPFCQSGNVYQNYITYTCNNPGTTNSTCTNSTTAQLQTTCTGSQTCGNGLCVNSQIACSTDAQCGMNSLSGNPFCQGNDVYTNQLTYHCNNPGTSQSFCSNALVPQLTASCGTNKACNNGSCASQSIICGSNSDCGFNSLSGNAFCQSGNVYQNYITRTCNNPGTTQSYCSSSITPQLIQTCSPNQGCNNGSCTLYQCVSDFQKQCWGNSLYWYSSCGQQQSFVQQCATSCSNGVCS